MLDELVGCVRASPAAARRSAYRVDAPARALFLQNTNAALVEKIAEDAPPGTVHTDDFAHITACFLWLMPCCDDATALVDAYNGMHAAGVLWCKACYLEVFNTEAQSTPEELFPGHPKLHICKAPVHEMPFSVCTTFLLAIQNDWKMLLRACALACLRALLLCAATVGYYVSREHDTTVLDSDEHVQARSARVLTRKATRTLVTTLHGLLRSWCLREVAHPVAVGAATAAAGTPVAAATAPTSRHTAILARVRAAWRAQGATATGHKAAWAELARALEPTSIGDAPHKPHDELERVVQAAAVLAMPRPVLAGPCTVPADSLCALENALAFYYIVPSAPRFKELVLQERVLPGQRLNYAFDYQHFDTGQLSQVVYFHNPMHRTVPAPMTLDDWAHDGVSGPVAAFAQLHPFLQVWFTDCDDPLGILGHDTLRTRPAHHKIPPERPEGLPAVFWQWIFVVEAADTYVVDRASGAVWRAADPPPTHDGHPILPLLVLFLDAIGGARAAAGVAVTAFRTFHAIA